MKNCKHEPIIEKMIEFLPDEKEISKIITIKDKILKDFSRRNLGCCGGDNCPNYEPIRDNDGNTNSSNHDEALLEFITQSIEDVYKMGIQEAIDYISKNEGWGETCDGYREHFGLLVKKHL